MNNGTKHVSVPDVGLQFDDAEPLARLKHLIIYILHYSTVDKSLRINIPVGRNDIQALYDTREELEHLRTISIILW